MVQVADGMPARMWMEQVAYQTGRGQVENSDIERKIIVAQVVQSISGKRKCV
jgi:hypothetical protein